MIQKPPTDRPGFTPGSGEARRSGCTCPAMDNHHGYGIPTDRGPAFWVADDCPLHKPEEGASPLESKPA